MIKIGTRGSALALWQAHYVKALLEQSGFPASIQIIETTGDRVQNLSFDKMEGKGFFTKEIEEALLDCAIDVAVHSMKDLPTVSPPGLSISAILGKEYSRDVLLLDPKACDENEHWKLKRNAKVGTSSTRRKALLRLFRPDLQLVDLRGNVPTRIQRLREGNLDAIILAEAGIKRLNADLEGLIKTALPVEEFVPAAAQGVLALQVRSDDHSTLGKVELISQKNIAKAVSIERSVLAGMDAGCLIPFGAHCVSEADDDTGKVSWVCRVTYTPDEQKPAWVFRYETQNEVGFSERILRHLQSVKPARVFITRKLHADSFMKKALEAHGFILYDQLLAEYSPVSWTLPSADFSWIFFSSKQAVRYFMKRYKHQEGIKYGAIGKGTADELRKYQQRASFIGQSTDTARIGKQFAAMVGKSHVLFPVASNSMRSVQKQFPVSNQCIDLVVYRTEQQIPDTFPEADVYLVSSPANAEVLLSHVPVRPDARWIAFGDATAKVLQKKGIRNPITCESFDEAGQYKAILFASAPWT